MSAAAENVVGGVLIGGKTAYWRVADLLTPEDFPSRLLANLFRVCGEVAKSSAELDVFTVGDEAERQGVADTADVIQIASDTASAANIRGHAELVKSAAVARLVKSICSEGAKSGDVATVQAELSALLSAQPAHAKHAGDVLKRMWDDLLQRYTDGDEMTGISTGFPAIDEMTGGLQPGRVYGIGARAKMGKTILAMNICTNVALAGHSVAIWSLEMGDTELMQRMSCAVADVPAVVMQRPRLLDKIEGSTERLKVAVQRLRDAPLHISDRTDVSIEEVEAQARQMHASGHCSVLCIDYLGLLKLPKKDRHDLAIAHMTRRVKIIAKELKIPVILVFQLNRGSENGLQVRPPRPSDARDSGSIEQDLDAMFLLHRPNYYDKNAESGLRLDLALQRNGPTGLIRLDDQLDRCRFVSTSRGWSESQSNGGMDENL